MLEDNEDTITVTVIFSIFTIEDVFALLKNLFLKKNIFLSFDWLDMKKIKKHFFNVPNTPQGLYFILEILFGSARTKTTILADHAHFNNNKTINFFNKKEVNKSISCNKIWNKFRFPYFSYLRIQSFFYLIFHLHSR